MGFSIFIWFVSGVLFLFLGICDWINFFINKKIQHSFLKGIAILILISFLYVPISYDIWMKSNLIIFPMIQNNFFLKETWVMLYFFRNIWPAFLVALFVVSCNKNVKTRQFRMMKTFGHSKIFVLVISFAFYILFDMLKVSSTLKFVFLNIGIYTAIFYWRLGFATVLYTLKKVNISYLIGMALGIVIPICVGEYFLIPLFLYVGIGISDIWMDYQQREVGEHLFHINFK